MNTKTDRTRTTAERIRAQRGMTPEQKIRDTETIVLRKWARKNAPLAKAELERRGARRQFEAEIPPRSRRLEQIRNAAHTDIREQIILDHNLDLGV